MGRKSFPIPFSLILLLCFTALLLIYPEESAAAARDGLTICFDLIIPSLFPFFVLSSLFVSMGFAALAGNYLSRWMGPLFRLSGSCAAALILGAVGGYPVGMRTAAQLYESKACTKEDARRLSAFCNNCGPAFLLSVTGVGIFSSRTAGFLLLGTHLAAALLVGALFRFFPVSHPSEPEAASSSPGAKASFSAVFPDCVRDSFSSTLNVCAFVILFSVILRLASCSGALPWAAARLAALLPPVFTPELCRSWIAGVFELSTGIYTLAEVSQSPAALPLAAFILGWGGLSVHCQSLPFLSRCVSSLKPYFLGKLLQGIFAAGLTALLVPLLLPAGTVASISMETAFWGSSNLQLLQQELVALWGMAGISYLLHRKKRLEKHRSLDYNRTSR